MPLVSGSKLGPYQILSPLGAGGMGEVYRARDTKLGREVALKVLAEAFAQDAERMARFHREAQMLASLNHPNIAAIYGMEESSGIRALVMELVEGPTLAERICVGARGARPSGETGAGGSGSGSGGARRSPLQLDEVLHIAKQITEALEYAHERGIIHRDLKPANVKVTHDGAVKVLDFGLAKALDPEVSNSNLANSPTISMAATRAGMILGTAAYMSPEQAKGKTVDRRTDIWAFGCVLYEMLTGTQAFQGETVSDVLAAVLRAEPDWGVLPATTPAPIRRLVRRSLIKDTKQRLQAIGEARITIEEALSGMAEEPPTKPVSPSTPRAHVVLWVLLGLLSGALLSGLAVWKWPPHASSFRAMHFSVVTNFAGVQAQPSLSPDGRSVAFVSNRDGHFNIYVGLITGGSLVQITNDPNLKARPRWSPDGTTIAYSALNGSGIWDIWEVAALGGTPRRLILNASDPAWSPDGGSIAYTNTSTGGIWISLSSGQNARELTRPDPPLYDADPSFSPDSRELALVQRGNGPYGELEVADLTTGKVRQLTYDGALALSPAWSRDSRSIYFASSRAGTLNIWKMAASGGEPEQITAGQGDDAQLDVSSDGKRIVFSTYHENINIAEVDLEAKAGQSKPRLLTTDPARNQLAPVYSPDGKQLVYFSNREGAEKEGIWIANADSSNPVKLVEDERINLFPRWTPDGQHLIYLSQAGFFTGATNEYRRVAISGGAPQVLLKNATQNSFDVGPDGRLLFWSPEGQIQSFDPNSNKTQTLATLPTGKNSGLLRWSPDGRSMDYILQPNHENDQDAGLWVDDFKSPPRQVFRGWIAWYAWGPQGKIYVLEGKPDLNGILWRVGWDGQGLTRTSATIPLCFFHWTPMPRGRFDVSPDGRHLAMEVQEVFVAHIGTIENLR